MQEVYGKRIPETVQCGLVVRDGHVSTEIIRLIEETDADLTVVGAFGLSGYSSAVWPNAYPTRRPVRS